MKKYFSLTAIVTLFFSAITFSQPNLIVSQSTLLTSNVSTGNALQLSYNIKNIGNAASQQCHSRVYLSTTSTLGSGAIALGELSCEALAAGKETAEVKYISPLPYNISAASYYVFIKADSRNEVAETDENNNFIMATSLQVNATAGGQQNLPYPIIFIHGLNSDQHTWDPLINDLKNLFGWSYGGNMDFCLNQDGNLATSNKATDYKDWTNLSSLSAKDFYTINFNVSPTGTSPADSYESNQSAITKQGLAVRDAIAHVLQVTGKDKVILVGHSMGGLASREYLQNASLWQPDAKHHVAKLVSLAVPHGGSNASGFGLTSVDEKSEAVRDLRIYFSGASKPGTYLFGSVENTSSIDKPYNNIDVNCNGISGDNTTVVGLNQKTIPTDVAYSCVIGTNSILGGDGVVQTPQANLKNYYPSLAVDTFISKAPAFTVIWHTEVQKQTATVVKAMDEPYNNTAYDVAFDKNYFGNFTVQSAGAVSATDVDDYKFTAPSDGVIKLNLFDLPIPSVQLDVLDNTSANVYTASSASKADTTFSFPVNTGNYNFSVSGIADPSAWITPYAFKLTFTPNVILPLHLLNFTATQIASQVKLHWLTTNEVNTSNFVIEHSANAITWQPIGNVASANTNSADYNFTDQNPVNGYNYYRLKMLDKDGAFTYSAVQAIYFDDVIQAFTLSPNPAVSMVVIHFAQPVNNAVITLMDAQGRKLSEKNYNGMAVTNYNMPVLNLPAGVYFITISTAKQLSTQRLVIIK
ncbi:MAG: alpha/beta fold hydrolase [Bacteroidetes bacterium]|nr:alpha/beta fold hydrolase [Bacteroidota bacterium]MBS1757159.1 alpha/beta fold hydrolase [Bacteroidota bacterium]